MHGFPSKITSKCAAAEIFPTIIILNKYCQDSGSSRRLVGAGSSPVSRTKALKTLRFQGFFLFGFDLCGTKLGAGASGEGGCRKGEAA